MRATLTGLVSGLPTWVCGGWGSLWKRATSLRPSASLRRCNLNTVAYRHSASDVLGQLGRALARIRGRQDDAVRALRQAELISAPRVQRHPFVREVLAEMLVRSRRDAVGRSAISRVSSFRFVPLPGTQVYDQVDSYLVHGTHLQSNWDGDWSKFHIHNQRNWWGTKDDWTETQRSYQ